MSKHVLIGVTGSIAAYKACELVRLFVTGEYDTHVAMTNAGTKFVTPLTFQTLSGNPVRVELFDDPSQKKPFHISMAELCDIIVVAPCTANVIAKIAHGIADDYLTSTISAFKKPIVIAPAMNVNMWENPATQDNIKTLRKRGLHIIEPDEGDLACGIKAKGRLPSPAQIYQTAIELL